MSALRNNAKMSKYVKFSRSLTLPKCVWQTRRQRRTWNAFFQLFDDVISFKCGEEKVALIKWPHSRSRLSSSDDRAKNKRIGKNFAKAPITELSLEEHFLAGSTVFCLCSKIKTVRVNYLFMTKTSTTSTTTSTMTSTATQASWGTRTDTILLQDSYSRYLGHDLDCFTWTSTLGHIFSNQKKKKTWKSCMKDKKRKVMLRCSLLDYQKATDDCSKDDSTSSSSSSSSGSRRNQTFFL